MKTIYKAILIFSILLLSSCATLKKVHFPDSEGVFITSGDGDITRPYEPVGELLYMKTGFRLSFLPLFGLIPISDASAEHAINTVIAQEVRTMGGDAVINLKIRWDPPSNGILGVGAKGGSLFVKGTVIKRSGSDAPFTPITTESSEPAVSMGTHPSRTGQSYDHPHLFGTIFQGTPIHAPSLAYANISGDGGGGIRFGYAMRRRDVKFSLGPAVSYGTHTATSRQQIPERVYNPVTGRDEIVLFEEKLVSSAKLIPIELNATMNLSAIPEVSAGLPSRLHPYIETGLTYYLWQGSVDYSRQHSNGTFSYSNSQWDFFELGMNAGVGLEYEFAPGFAIHGGFKRYFVFTEGNIQTWNFQVGVSLY